MNSMHLSKPNVYKTLVLLWRQSRPGLGLLPINATHQRKHRPIPSS